MSVLASGGLLRTGAQGGRCVGRRRRRGAGIPGADSVRGGGRDGLCLTRISRADSVRGGGRDGLYLTGSPRADSARGGGRDGLCLTGIPRAGKVLSRCLAGVCLRSARAFPRRSGVSASLEEGVQLRLRRRHPLFRDDWRDDRFLLGRLAPQAGITLRRALAAHLDGARGGVRQPLPPEGLLLH